MVNNKKQSKGMKPRLTLLVIGGILVLVVLFLIFSDFFSSVPEQEIIMSEESNRINSGLVDYWNDLEETSDLQLKRIMDNVSSSYLTGEYPTTISNLTFSLQANVKDEERVALLVLNGNSLLMMGNPIQAGNQYQTAWILAQKVDDKNAKASVYGNLGVTYLRNGYIDSALTCHQIALNLFREAGSKKEEAIQLGNLGLVNQFMGDFQSALQYHREALNVFREIDYPLGEICQLNQLGWIYQINEKMDSSMVFYQEALEINKRINFTRGEASQLSNIGLVYQNKGFPDAALDYYRQALNLDKKEGYKQGEAQDLLTIGWLYEQKGDLQGALREYESSLKIIQRTSSRDRIIEVNALAGLGRVNNMLENREEALNFFNQALDINKETGNLQSQAGILHTLGKAYETQSPDSAVTYYGEALKIYREIGDIRSQAKELNSMGMLFRKHGQTDLSLQAFGGVLKLTREAKDRRGEAYTLSSMATVYIGAGNIEQGLNLAKESIAIFLEIGANEEAVKVAENIKEVDKMLQQQKDKGPEKGQ